MSPSTPPASWILSRWLPDLLLLYSKIRKPSSPATLPDPGPKGCKSHRHTGCGTLTSGKSIQPRFFSASLPHQRRAKHTWYQAISCTPPVTTEHTKPPPINLRIRRSASTSSQESDAPTMSETPLVSSDFLGPAGDHRAHKTTLESCDLLAQATKKAMHQSTAKHQ